MDLMETIITFFLAYGFIWSVHNKITIDKMVFPSYIQTSLFLSMFPWFFPIWSHGFSPSASCQETDDPELRPDAADCDLVHPVAVDGSHRIRQKKSGTRETAGKQLDKLDFGFDIWQWVKTNSTPVVHIKIVGIYGCSPKNGINRY